METTTPNWALLGGLRFGLASIVMLLHGALFFGFYNRSIEVVMNLSSFAAVMGFFMVSGFSIRASIEREPRGFYMRRVHRIVPVYYTCFVLAVVFMSLAGRIVSPTGTIFDPPSMPFFLSSFLLLNNITVGPYPPIGPAWSLTPECIYYLFAPLLLKVSWRVVAVVAVLCSAYYLRVGAHYASALGLAPLFAMYWAWLMGWLMHQFLGRNGREEGEVMRAVLIVIPLVIIGAWNPHKTAYAGLTLSVTAFCLLYGHRMPLSERVGRLLSYLGELSFPLYLSHTLAALMLFHFTGASQFWSFLVASLLLAALIHHGVEMPYRKMARNLARREQKIQSASARAV